MTYELIQGSAHSIPAIPDGSVHAIITSPPYYSLRSYAGDQAVEWPAVEYSPMPGLAPITIPGCDPDCDHEWGNEIVLNGSKQGWSDKSGLKRDGRPESSRVNTILNSEKRNTQSGGAAAGNYCQRCGGWRGPLGLEPTVEAYIGHLILVMREMWRVLRDDGVCFVNLGDSYNGSGGAGGDYNAGGLKEGQPRYPGRNLSTEKPKDLLGVPFRFVFAAKADGWYWRTEIPWPKKNAMPGSQQDRPTTGHEHIFLLTKSPRYFYDQEAVKVPLACPDAADGSRIFGGANKNGANLKHGDRTTGRAYDSTPNGRIRRTTDWWFDALRWHIAHWQDILDNGGPLVSDEGEIVALQVNTRGYSAAHFATFPPELVEPLIRAGTSERGCCPECGSPWERVVERGEPQRIGGNAGVSIAHADGPMNRNGKGQWDKGHMPMVRPSTTSGWQPTCTCYGQLVKRQTWVDFGAGREYKAYWSFEPHEGVDVPDPIPCVVLDPFVGSGTTLEVAIANGRRGIGVDISQEYLTELVPDRVGGTQIRLPLLGGAL